MYTEVGGTVKERRKRTKRDSAQARERECERRSVCVCERERDRETCEREKEREKLMDFTKGVSVQRCTIPTKWVRWRRGEEQERKRELAKVCVCV